MESKNEYNVAYFCNDTSKALKVLQFVLKDPKGTFCCLCKKKNW